MKYIILLFISFCLFSCSVCEKNGGIKNIEGHTFSGKESQEAIKFINEKFVLKSFSEFVDTLSYGKWENEGNLIILYSDKKIHNDFFDIDVVESFSGSKDSVYISIENRLDGLSDASNAFTPYIYFNINRHFVNNQFDESIQFAKNISLSNSNPLSKFNLKIIPNLIIYPERISGKAFKTFDYEVKSSKNNTFKIKITDFNLKYFAYRRLNGEYVKILDNDTLLWDNELYIRKKS